MPGAIPEASRYFAAVDIAALTSWEEGLPNALMEAGVAGVPAVSTRAGGASEIVVDGETGYLVPLGDVTRFTDRLEHLLADPLHRASLGAAARARMLASFTVARMATSMVAAYEAGLARAVA
jgi:glycosyltransferase involved in cell wall biosynthesis